VHLGNHWTCAMVDLAARALVYYDSYHVRTRGPPAAPAGRWSVKC